MPKLLVQILMVSQELAGATGRFGLLPLAGDRCRPEAGRPVVLLRPQAASSTALHAGILNSMLTAKGFWEFPRSSEQT
ncbi:hypothetical protein D3C75_1203040 [compost metagenome]